ncbi:MAG: hypothetical protein ACJ8AW_42380, partial [Rhodopila sp.]
MTDASLNAFVAASQRQRQTVRGGRWHETAAAGEEREVVMATEGPNVAVTAGEGPGVATMAGKASGATVMAGGGPPSTPLPATAQSSPGQAPQSVDGGPPPAVTAGPVTTPAVVSTKANHAAPAPNTPTPP